MCRTNYTTFSAGVMYNENFDHKTKHTVQDKTPIGIAVFRSPDGKPIVESQTSGNTFCDWAKAAKIFPSVEKEVPYAKNKFTFESFRYVIIVWLDNINLNRYAVS